MKERINLLLIIIALWTFLFVFQNYVSTVYAIYMLLGFMFLYGLYMQIAYKHRKRKLRKNPQIPNENYKPFVTVMVPAHNEQDVIEKTIENVVNLNYPNFEVIVIDDRSSDNTAERILNLQEKYENVTALIRDKNAFPGKSAVLNDALKIAKGEAILVFDADARFDANFLNILVPALENENVGAVQARKVIINKDYNYLTRCQNNEYALDCYTQVGRDCVKGAVELRGNGELIKREALTDIGGWNNYTITDDLDMSTRLHIKGWDIRFVPNAIVYEEGITKVLPLLRQRRRWVEGSIRRYLENINDVLFTDKMSLRTGFDMLAYISEFILPFWLLSEVIFQIFRYAKDLENSVLSSVVVSIAVTIFGVIAIWYGLCKYNSQRPLKALVQSVETSLYMFFIWFPLVFFIILKLLFCKKTMDWGKTEHGFYQENKEETLIKI